MSAKSSTFTGRHMAAVFVGGFGIVIAVNLFMAWQAVGGFHGTVVDNSYVASQKYNGWLDKAESARALGWQVLPVRRKDGRVVLETLAVPANATIMAEAERPLGEREATRLTFAPESPNSWISDKPLGPGRWQLRMTIRAPGQAWAGDSDLK